MSWLLTDDNETVRIPWGIFLFIGLVGVGNFIAERSWHGVVYVYVGEQRAPSSVRKSYDYAPLDGKALSRSVHEQILAETKLDTQAGVVNIRLGHPLVARPEGGGREFACDVLGRSGAYDRMELTFYGTGISDGGEEPHMVVDTICAGSASDLSALQTVWIPMQDIVSAPAADRELQVDGGQPVTIHLQHIPAQWPENWVLTKVRFYRQDNPDQDLVVNAKQMLASGYPLPSFDFKQQQ